MDIKEIRELLKLVDKHGVQDFTFQKGDTRIRVRKGGLLEEPVIYRGREAVPVEAPARPAAATAAEAPTATADDTLAVGENQFLVTSPIVGTFYRSPSPESPAYVDVGSTVGKGAVMCIVEAMKIMNEIECEVSGKVSSILVDNAQPVEYGQPLFIVDLS